MASIPQEYLSSEWDFGFTAVDEETVSSPIVTNVTTTAEEQLKAKLLEVEKLIMPLLVNLMKNPDKEYIHWPNRTPLIQKQVDRILSITRG
jgi:hypothetical protein